MYSGPLLPLRQTVLKKHSPPTYGVSHGKTHCTSSWTSCSSCGSGRGTSRSKCTAAASTEIYTPTEVRAPTFDRENAEKRAAQPELRDVFLCHPWDERNKLRPRLTLTSRSWLGKWRAGLDRHPLWISMGWLSLRQEHPERFQGVPRRHVQGFRLGFTPRDISAKTVYLFPMVVSHGIAPTYSLRSNSSLIASSVAIRCSTALAFWPRYATAMRRNIDSIVAWVGRNP